VRNATMVTELRTPALVAVDVQRARPRGPGEKRTVIEVRVDEVGPSLRYATAKMVKTTRTTLATRAGGVEPAVL
jgi:hypothetical protein